MRYMPQMDGITGFYEWSKNVDTVNGIWGSRISGGVDIEIHSPNITADYIEFVGSDESYAKLTYSGEPGGNSYNTQCIRYAVFRNLSGVYGNWKTIIGNETGTNYCSTIAMNSSGKLQFTRGEIYASDAHCKDWHVVCWTSDSVSGTSTLWIDGVKKGTANRCSGWGADTYFCKGPSWSYSDNNTAFKFFAIGDIIHSDADIIKNSKYLLGRIDSKWIMSNNHPTNTEFADMPESYMSKPYPAALWRMGNNGIPYHYLMPDIDFTLSMPYMSKPYPKALWRIDKLTNDGIPYHLLMPDIESKGRGAFFNAKKLTRVSIPESVKKIGKEAFRYTALKTVRIAPDCEFYDTSFPDNCEILFYGGGSYFVPLYDKNDFILLDKTGAQIVVRSKSNG